MDGYTDLISLDNSSRILDDILEIEEVGRECMDGYPNLAFMDNSSCLFHSSTRIPGSSLFR